jgi:hypothetical protein
LKKGGRVPREATQRKTKERREKVVAGESGKNGNNFCCSIVTAGEPIPPGVA